MTIETYIQFEQRLLIFFSQESIEAGIYHRAEGVLDDAFINSPDAEQWILQFSEKYFHVRSSIMSGLVTCLGRSSYDVSFGYDLVRRCLQQDSISLREAAMGYLETKGGPEAIKILSMHHETVKWLNDYKDQVIRDLQQ